MNKFRKIPLAIVVAIIIGGVSAAFFLDTPEPSVWVEDTLPMKKRFVGFSDVVSARWKCDTLTKNSRFSVPGPTDYHLYGYFVVPGDEARTLENEFKWQPATSCERFRDVYDDCESSPFMNRSVKDWHRNEEFTKRFMPKSWHGSLYFSPKSNTVLFSLVTN